MSRPITRGTDSGARPSAWRRARRAPLATAAAALSGALWTACGGATGTQLPGSRTPVVVQRVVPHGGYLEAIVASERAAFTTWLPANAACRAVFAEEDAVEYVAGGTGGSFLRAGERCEAAGIGSLARWRDSRPRPRTGGPVPSAQATFQQTFEDEELILLRGHFPLAGLVGWTGSGDTVAVVRKSDWCARLVTSRVATMQFFPAGRNVLTLTAGDGLCPIDALLVPLAQTSEWES